MKATVTGLGWVTAAGLGYGRGMANFDPRPGILSEITRRSVFSEPYERFGRMDVFSKVGVSAVALALRDANLESWSTKRAIGLVASTRYGCVHTDLDYFRTVLPEGGGLPSPHLFAYTLPNCFLGEAAIRFGLTGPAFILHEAGGDGLSALEAGLESLAFGETAAILVGTCDLTPPEGLPHPQGFWPGAAFCVLQSGGQPRGYGQVSLADQAISFNGQRVVSLAGLVRLCLAMSPRLAGC